MPEFVWQAARADAQRVEGRSQASDAAQVLRQLRAQGLTPLKVGEADADSTGAALVTHTAGTQAKGKGRRVKRQAITAEDILIMTSELSIMLKAGLALDNALRVLIGMNTKAEMATLTQSILDDVKDGVPLSRSLGRHPRQFGEFYINMVHSGEASGHLSDVLERLVEHLDRVRALRESVVSATIYPAILLVVALLSIISMLGFVVPQFETLFKGMGDALPTPTRIIMTIGHLFTDYGLVGGLVLALLLWLTRRWLGTPAGRQWWQARALRLPVVGKLMLKYDLTLFARSLGTLLGNGVPLLSALRIATQTVSNAGLRLALEGVVPRVKGGAKMVDALGASGIFEPLAISLIKVGEETGRLGPMLLELARIFNRDVETGIKRGLTVLEPALILILGMLIAAIIVSIMLGILSVNDLAI